MLESVVDEIRNEYGEDNAKKTADVIVVVSAKVRAKNLFGWRSFIEDALVETVSWMIHTKFQYSGGAYVACGMQAALDRCRYCSALKRRQNYESLSLNDDEAQIQVAGDEDAFKKVEMLCMDIGAKFGEELARQLKPFLEGNAQSLSDEVMKKIKSKQFKEWFRSYAGE